MWPASAGYLVHHWHPTCCTGVCHCSMQKDMHRESTCQGKVFDAQFVGKHCSGEEVSNLQCHGCSVAVLTLDQVTHLGSTRDQGGILIRQSGVLHRRALTPTTNWLECKTLH